MSKTEKKTKEKTGDFDEELMQEREEALTKDEIMEIYRNVPVPEGAAGFNLSIRQTGKTYQDKKEKMEDVKSSVVTLFLVGGIGLILDVLCVLDLLPFHFSPSGKLITCGTMALLFLAMLIFGFISMRSLKGIRSQAKEEDKLTSEIEKWYRTELSREMIEEGLFKSSEEEEMPEELKYFKRSQKIGMLLGKKFMNLEQSYAENMVEKIYQEFYDE